MPDKFSANMRQGKAIHHSLLMATANACMFVFGVILLLMGSLLPSLPVSYTQAGNLGSFPLAGILVASILVGPILDIIGAKPILVLALALTASSLATIPLLHGYAQLAGAAVTYGLGGGLLNTAANALVADLSASGRAAALNLLGFSFSLGAFSAPLAMSSLIGTLSSTIVLRVLAAVCSIILMAVLAFDFPRPTHTGPRIRSLLSVLNRRPVWVFATLLFFESGSENCVFVWAAKIVADVLNTSAERANLALVGLSLALGTGRLMAILWLRWIGSRGTIWLSTGVVVVGALLVSASTGLALMVAGMVVIGLGLSAIFPTTLGIAGDRFPNETGTVFGALMTVALLGGTLSPTLAARLAAHGPLRVLSIPIAAAATIAVLTSLIGDTPLNKEP